MRSLPNTFSPGARDHRSLSCKTTRLSSCGFTGLSRIRPSHADAEHGKAASVPGTDAFASRWADAVREGKLAQIKQRAAVMEINTFKDMYLAELQELASVEA